MLVNPRFPESFWSLRWAVREVLPGKRSVNPPLGLATLAALCPPHWQVTIVDENIEPVPSRPDADIVGVCGMGVQFERQRSLLAQYRNAGYYTVAGGSFASLCPERYEGLADTVVSGEAERVWAQFCADYEREDAGPAALYRETGVVDLADSPTPRFDLLQLSRYTTATMQFSRGCPYRCEFCDIIVMFGRKPRHKSIEQVERELDALRAQGARSVFFVDDNLIGNRAVARNLLEFLVQYQRRHGNPFRFGTEVSINLAQQPDLLALFRDAGFTWVFIGVESPDPEALKLAKKTQNTTEDVLVSIRRIYEYGIDVLAGMIVGFDTDTPETFGSQLRFLLASGIQLAMVGLLTALPKTPLYERLAAAGRLRSGDGTDNTRSATNIVPLRMTYGQLVDGYERLYRVLTADRAIARRIVNKLRYMADPVRDTTYSAWQQARIVLRFFRRGIFPGGPVRWLHFLRSIPWRRPSQLYLVINDWILGLAMRDYVERHFHRVRDSGAPADEEAFWARVLEP